MPLTHLVSLFPLRKLRPRERQSDLPQVLSEAGGPAVWLPYPLASPSGRLFFLLQYSKHLFVHISQSSPSYSDPYLEAVDIRQIYDKFPEKKGGLKELFERGPSNAFFLVKFWVSPGPLLPSLSALRWWGSWKERTSRCGGGEDTGWPGTHTRDHCWWEPSART